jgi:hypothetical protein
MQIVRGKLGFDRDGGIEKDILAGRTAGRRGFVRLAQRQVERALAKTLDRSGQHRGTISQVGSQGYQGARHTMIESQRMKRMMDVLSFYAVQPSVVVSIRVAQYGRGASGGDVRVGN